MDTPPSPNPTEAAPAKDPLQAAHERLGPRLKEAQAQLATINQKVQAFVKENPGTSLLGALALGFVVGKLVSKK